MEQRSAGALIAGGLVVLLLVIMTPVLLLAGGTGNPAQAASQCPTPSGSSPNDSGQKSTITVPDEYKEPITQASKTAGMPYEVLAAQLNQESGFNPKAQSPVGARGIAQFMPGTWASYGNGKDPFDALAGIDAQGRYMRDLAKQIAPLATNDNDKIRLSLAAYNAGPGNVLKHKGIPPFKETQNYVKIIMSNAQVTFSDTCTEPGASTELGEGEWAHPWTGAHITSRYGNRPCPLSSCAGQPYLLFHEGIDIAGGNTLMFSAPTDMKITYVGRGPSDPLWAFYGEYIYAQQVDPPHLYFEFHEAAPGSLMVKTGDTVKAGTPLGRPGATGNSSGIHVHFQINKANTPNMDKPKTHNGWSLDPLPFLTEKGIY